MKIGRQIKKAFKHTAIKVEGNYYRMVSNIFFFSLIHSYTRCSDT